MTLADTNMTESKKIIFFISLQKPDKMPDSLNPALTKESAHWGCHTQSVWAVS